jgi:hydrogenase maturation protein HypF
MYLKELNSPLSSSVGRLFDAVLSLSGIGQTLGYEGESGLLLECHAEQSKVKETFSYEINGSIIDCHAMVNEILDEKDKNSIALKFISMLSSIIVDISKKYPDLKIVFSGGVFQNRLLVSMITNALKKRNRVYYMQEETPVNDGGIALGQVYHAYHVKKENNGK